MSTVIAVVDDMFFASKIRATAGHMGVAIKFVKSLEAVMEEARRERPAFVVADLHAQKCDPFELALKLKADEQLSGVPLLGFFSHVRVELQQKAKESGFDRVLTRSAFTKQLPEILQSADDPGA